MDGVAVVRLGTGLRRNALSLASLARLTAVARRLAAGAEPSLGAAVLTARGPDFSSGADLAEVLAARSDPEAYIGRVQEAVAAWAELPCPTVAALEGWVLGLGLELAAASDLRVAAKSARLGLPEIRHGLHPAAGGLVRLARLIGPSFALRLALTGEAVAASDLVATGFIAHLAEDGQAEAHALRLARFLAERPLAARAAKEAVRSSEPPGLVAGLAAERRGFARSVGAPETARRLAAFFGARDATPGERGADEARRGPEGR